MPFNQLPEDMILRIFFILFEEPSLLFAKRGTSRICGDASIVRKAPSLNFESIRLHECLTYCNECLPTIVRRVIWVRTADVKFSKILSLLFW